MKRKQIGRVGRKLNPGDPGTQKYIDRYGKNLVAVRYHYDERRNMRSTTVQLVVEQSFWDGSPAVPPTWAELNNPLSNTRQ